MVMMATTQSLNQLLNIGRLTTLRGTGKVGSQLGELGRRRGVAASLGGLGRAL